MTTSEPAVRKSKGRKTKPSAPVAPIEPHGPRVGDLNVFDTHLGVWEDNSDFEGMRRTFHVMLDVLRSRGFTVDQDPRVDVCIRRDYYLGRKGDLEFYAYTGGRTAQVEFFQNLNIENRNGGRYDFDKFQKMPRSMRFACVVELTAIAKVLIDLGYALGSKVDAKGPLLWKLYMAMSGRRPDGETPLERFNQRWEANRFKRDENGWPTESEIGGYGNQTGMDKQPLRCGDTRYFRLRGRLMRGTVYTNKGNMWQVCYGGSVTYESASRLFSCENPTEVPRRYIPGQAKRVRAELQKATDANNYDRVAVLAKVCKARSEGRFFHLLSLKYSKSDEPALTWWAIDSAGYTYKIANAGLYTAAEAKSCGGDGTIVVASEVVAALVKDGVVSREHLAALKRKAVKPAKPGSTS